MRKFKTTIHTKALLLCAILFSLLFSNSVYAQPGARKITGKISSGSGKLLGSASVINKRTNLGTYTDNSGAFTVQAVTGDVLIISYVGYQRKEIKIGKSDNIDITINEEQSKMDEVVVIGYGKMKKTDLSSAVVSISNTDLQRTVNVTLDEALQGKAPNVYVSQTSGQPGAGASVVIRGVSTVTGNYQPLYVIDGVQIRPSVPTGGTYNQPAGYSNEVSGINPDDIENISVLQGPAATSIYGAAGANGVLMITTKHGKAGLTKVSASTLFNSQQKPTERPVMNLQEYAIYVHRLQSIGATGVQPAELNDPSILGAGTNWQNALFHNTLLQKHSLAISGGTDKSTFYFSGDYLSQDGVALGSGFTRGSVRINLDNQANNWLKFGVNLSAFSTKEKVNISNGDIITIAIQQNPTIPVKNPDGSFGGPAPAQTQYAQTNPVAIATLNNNYNTSFGVIGGLYLDITPVKHFLWHTELNGNYTFNNNYSFNPSYSLGTYVNPNTQGGRSSGNNTWASLNTRVQYDLTIKKHNIMAMIGHEATKYTYQNLNGQGQNYSTNTIQELSVSDSKTQTTSSGRGAGSGESYFGRLNYIYNEKYIAQLVVRRDGSSSFGPSNRFGTFPAVSVAWKISDEPFMKSIPFLNDLKLRAEYGISGNSGGTGGAIYAGLYSASTVWGGGFLPANFPNPDLKWEQDKSTNVGIDMHLFNNRVEVIGDAYIKDISNLILLASNAIAYGGNLSGGYGGLISWPVQNYGGMQNRGFGITLNTVNISKKDFQWKTGVNFSVDRNKITKLVTPILTQYTDNFNTSQAQFLTTVGQPLSMITGYIAEGIFQNYQEIAKHAVQSGGSTLNINPVSGSWVGDIKFKDISGPNGTPDGIIDEKDRTIIGNPWPKFTYNFNSSFSYKGFDLNLFFTGVYGNQILNLTRYQNEQPLGNGVYGNHYKSVADFARPSSTNLADAATVTVVNPGGIIPRAIPGDPNQNLRLSQWNLESGSYLKLKNVRLSYRVPSKFLSATHVFKGALVTIQSQNLFTVTNYTGFDPEVGMYNYKGVANIVGLDQGRYPSTRSYSVSLALDF